MVATPRGVLVLRPGIFDRPSFDEQGNCTIVIKQLHLDEVQYINSEIEKNSYRGFIFSKSK